VSTFCQRNIALRYTQMHGDEFPDCVHCGACCFSPSERYVQVSGDDHARLGDAAEMLTQFIGHRCYMRMESGHCAALQVRTDGTFLCSVYEQRPSLCRELARGGPACDVEREAKARWAAQALVQLRTR
jgi:uncharacterized protein